MPKILYRVTVELRKIQSLKLLLLSKLRKKLKMIKFKINAFWGTIPCSPLKLNVSE